MAPLEPNPPNPCLHAPSVTHKPSLAIRFLNTMPRNFATGTPSGCSIHNWGYCSISYDHLDGRWIKLNSSIDSVTSRYGEKPNLLGNWLGYIFSFWSLKSLHHFKTSYVIVQIPFTFGHCIAFSQFYDYYVNCIRSTHRSPQGLWSTLETYPYETLQVLLSSGQIHPVSNKFNSFSDKLEVEQHNGSHSSYVISLPFILCQETCKGHERKNLGDENSASSSTKGLCFLSASEEHSSSKANYLTACGPRKIMLIKSCINPADLHIHPSKYTSLNVAFTIFIKRQAYDIYNRLRPTKQIFFMQGINIFSAHLSLSTRSFNNNKSKNHFTNLRWVDTTKGRRCILWHNSHCT
ncbi:hypothetical protein Cgig2_013762 [Carnegiea gigantea]|uniref:Uncharacterized protein n=1 Tax=Carnegiea gigantea TaxID=171969 RepID=A0A9Q1K7E9_9CARY|nr:hypothetical protein Cgig2_013762 [Carnegiea gigantea]